MAKAEEGGAMLLFVITAFIVVAFITIAVIAKETARGVGWPKALIAVAGLLLSHGAWIPVLGMDNVALGVAIIAGMVYAGIHLFVWATNER
jgi:hypothetical protein